MKKRRFPLLVFDKKLLLKAVIIVFMLILIVSALLCAPAVIAATVKKMPVCSVETENKTVCLSFNVVCGGENVQTILKMLEASGVNAAFFVTGVWVENYPELVQQMIDGGHEIGTLGETNVYMTKLSRKRIAEELAESAEKITAITNTPVKFFRPPFGEFSNTLIDVCDELAMTAVQWDIDGLDWQGLSVDAIHERMVTKAKKGSILLLHTDGGNTAKAAALIIQTLKLKGFSFSTVSDLVLSENFRIDGTGRQYAAN